MMALARSLWRRFADACYGPLAWLFLQGRPYDLLQHRFPPAYRFLRMKEEWLAARSTPFWPLRVLDYACGSGYVAEVYRPGQYVGADINGDYIDFARRRFPEHEFVSLPGSGFTPFPDGSFDAVLLLSTLHHLSDEALTQVLEEAHRLLGARGRLLVIDTLPAEEQRSWVVRFMIRMDMGEWFRTAAQMEAAFAAFFEVDLAERMNSGPAGCGYESMAYSLRPRILSS